MKFIVVLLMLLYCCCYCRCFCWYKLLVCFTLIPNKPTNNVKLQLYSLSTSILAQYVELKFQEHTLHLIGVKYSERHRTVS